jgi:hypothetical protein
MDVAYHRRHFRGRRGVDHARRLPARFTPSSTGPSGHDLHRVKPSAALVSRSAKTFSSSIPMPDLLSNGNTIPQIFLFEIVARITGKRRPGLYQLTFGDQPSMAPSAANHGRVVAFPLDG